MANGWGHAVGEGAEAFKGALYPTLHYKIAMAQQQMEAGAQKERQRIEQEAADVERRINEQTLREAKWQHRQAKDLEKEIEVVAEAMVPRPSVAGTGVRAIRAGERVSPQYFERIGEKATEQRAITRMGLRKAPSKILFPAEETPARKLAAMKLGAIERLPAPRRDEVLLGTGTSRLTQTERDRGEYSDLYFRQQRGELSEQEQLTFNILDRKLGGGENFSNLFDEYEALIRKRPTGWTPKDRIRFSHLKQKVVGGSKKVDPVVIQNRVINLLKAKYGMLDWANKPVEEKLNEINQAGRFYYPESWTDMRDSWDVEDAERAGERVSDRPSHEFIEDVYEWIIEHPEDIEMLGDPKINQLPSRLDPEFEAIPEEDRSMYKEGVE